MTTQESHTYKPFDHELDQVRDHVLRMGGLVEDQIRLAARGWEHEEVSLLFKALENDAKVNSLEVEIDDLCRHVIARRQPIAGDLRILTTVLKLTTDVERIGDEASKIARLAEKNLAAGIVSALKFPQFFAAAEAVGIMLREALDAYARMDAHGAGQVVIKDDHVDSLVQAITLDAVGYLEGHPEHALSGVRVILMAKALERIGDHAKNIAEDVIYMVKGKDVRHQGIDHVLSQAG
jgi:phosphate transport system protein